MPYVPPNTFTAGTTISADDLRANNEALRKYLNKDIVPADIAADSVDYTDIVRGEYAGVVNSHQFTTSDLYARNYDGDNYQQIAYNTGWTKQGYPDQVSLYTAIEGTGGAFYLFDNARVFYNGYVDIHTPENNSMLYSTGTTVGAHDDSAVPIKLRLDGSVTDITEGATFEEYASGAVSGANDATDNRRWYSVNRALKNGSVLTAGWHRVDLVIDSLHDRYEARDRGYNLEIFYL